VTRVERERERELLKALDAKIDAVLVDLQVRTETSLGELLEAERRRLADQPPSWGRTGR
jgi:hypothetical protein